MTEVVFERTYEKTKRSLNKANGCDSFLICEGELRSNRKQRTSNIIAPSIRSLLSEMTPDDRLAQHARGSGERPKRWRFTVTTSRDLWL